jgi:hypothetical protein
MTHFDSSFSFSFHYFFMKCFRRKLVPRILATFKYEYWPDGDEWCQLWCSQLELTGHSTCLSHTCCQTIVCEIISKMRASRDFFSHLLNSIYFHEGFMVNAFMLSIVSIFASRFFSLFFNYISILFSNIFLFCEKIHTTF